MDGKAKCRAALARIKEQKEDISAAVYKTNLQLRKMALNLYPEEVERLSKDKKDGPPVYVRLYRQHARLERHAKRDLRSLAIQEKALKKGIVQCKIEKCHLETLELETELESESSDEFVDDPALPNYATREARWSMLLRSEKRRTAEKRANDDEGAVAGEYADEWNSDEQFEEEIEDDAEDAAAGIFADATISKEENKKLAKGEAVTRRVRQVDGSFAVKTLQWR